MNAIARLAAVCVAAVMSAPAALAGVSNFNGQTPGIYTSVVDGGVTYTYLGGDGRFNVEAASPGVPIDGNALISFRQNPGPAAFKATMAAGFSSFSIGCGDFGADDDNCVLEAYDINDVLLDSDTFSIPASSLVGGTMTVASASKIAYVLFYEVGTFAGAIYWDNARFDEFRQSAVPTPQTLALALLGLVGVAATARRRAA